MKYESLQAGKCYTVPTRTYVQVRKVQVPQEHYVIHYKGSYETVAQRLTASNAPNFSTKLFYCFASDLEYPYGNVVPYNAKDLAGRFGVSTANVYAAVAHLYYTDLIRKLKKHVLLLNPYLVFAGDSDHLMIARAEWDAATTLITA